MVQSAEEVGLEALALLAGTASSSPPARVRPAPAPALDGQQPRPNARVLSHAPAHPSPLKRAASLATAPDSPAGSAKKADTPGGSAKKARRRGGAKVELMPDRVRAANIMTVFDKDLDLAALTERSSLYSACRLWMANNPAPAPAKTAEQPALKPSRAPCVAPSVRTQTANMPAPSLEAAKTRIDACACMRRDGRLQLESRWVGGGGQRCVKMLASPR